MASIMVVSVAKISRERCKIWVIFTYRISVNSFRRNYSFLKVENVDIFIWFPHYGNFLLHKLNSCRGNYWRGETIRGNTVFMKIGSNVCRLITHYTINPSSFLPTKVYDKVHFSSRQKWKRADLRILGDLSLDQSETSN